MQLKTFLVRLSVAGAKGGGEESSRRVWRRVSDVMSFSPHDDISARGSGDFYLSCFPPPELRVSVPDF